MPNLRARLTAAASLLAAAALLVLCDAAGALLARAAGLPVPGPVLGALLLAALLGAWGRAPEPLERLGRWLLSHLNLLFIPAAVSVIQHVGLLRREALPLLAALTLSAALSLVVGALVFERLAGSGHDA